MHAGPWPGRPRIRHGSAERLYPLDVSFFRVEVGDLVLGPDAAGVRPPPEAMVCLLVDDGVQELPAARQRRPADGGASRHARLVERGSW
jgi:hypothetical protein